MPQRSSESGIQALEQAVHSARTADEIVDALASILWFTDHEGAACPEDGVPTLEVLHAWLPYIGRTSWSPVHQRLETLRLDPALPSFDEHLLALAAVAMTAHLGGGWSINAGPVHDQPPTARNVLFRWTPSCEDLGAACTQAHEQWRSADPQPRHPLGTLVQAWQQRPKLVDLDRRATGILPQSIIGDRQVDSRRRRDGQAHLPGLKPEPPREAQAYLPGLEPESSRCVPALPLILFDAAGVSSTSRGPGAALEMRLAVELLMALPRPSRSIRCEMQPTLAEVVAWLWPGKERPKPGRYWPALTTAMRTVNAATLPASAGRWRPIRVWHEPQDPRGLRGQASRRVLRERYRIEVRLPPGSEQGPRIDRPTLRAYGLQSSPKYRAWMGLSYIWHDCLCKPISRDSGTSVRWRLAPPQVPVVQRDKRTGGIVDARGQPVIRYGQPVRSALDHRAIPLLGPDGQPVSERNPAMDRVPELGPDELLELTQPDPEGWTGHARRSRLQLARRTIREMAADGNLELEINGLGWRILPPADILKRFRR